MGEIEIEPMIVGISAKAFYQELRIVPKRVTQRSIDKKNLPLHAGAIVSVHGVVAAVVITLAIRCAAMPPPYSSISWRGRYSSTCHNLFHPFSIVSTHSV